MKDVSQLTLANEYIDKGLSKNNDRWVITGLNMSLDYFMKNPNDEIKNISGVEMVEYEKEEKYPGLDLALAIFFTIALFGALIAL